MKNSQIAISYFFHLFKEIPNILQILTFQAFLALIIHNAWIIGPTTAILIAAYLSTREEFSKETEVKRKYQIADYTTAALLGALSGYMATLIVKVIQ